MAAKIAVLRLFQKVNTVKNPSGQSKRRDMFQHFGSEICTRYSDITTSKYSESRPSEIPQFVLPGTSRNLFPGRVRDNPNNCFKKVIFVILLINLEMY